ncbi:MAG: type II toxin-antitoxin system Phd/YefM family antitoxin [Pseudonocardiaceae bacterium]
MSIEEVGVAEAKRRFSELAERVSRGESFVILNRGRPTVALVPPQRARHRDHKPVGFAAVAGALAEWDTIDEDMAEVVATRKQAIDRPVPPLA